MKNIQNYAVYTDIEVQEILNINYQQLLYLIENNLIQAKYINIWEGFRFLGKFLIDYRNLRWKILSKSNLKKRGVN